MKIKKKKEKKAAFHVTEKLKQFSHGVKLAIKALALETP